MRTPTVTAARSPFPALLTATVLAADPAFTAWVTREAGESRRNKIHHTNTSVGYSGTLGVIDWWRPEARSPNPVTGQRWPNPIPFTGYLFLGIMPDGRTLEAGNVPVRWAAEKRNADLEPVSLNNGAVADTRVTTIFKSIQAFLEKGAGAVSPLMVSTPRDGAQSMRMAS